MKKKNVVVIGGGVLGSQIAFQSAYSGHKVTILIRKEDDLEEVKNKLNRLHTTYLETIKVMNTKVGKDASLWAKGIAENVESFSKATCTTKANKALAGIVIETDQAIALKDADVVVESITEIFDVKTALYKQISPLLNEKAILVTNSSTLLPSKLSKSVGRPDRFLALHFANNIWHNNIAEVMGHAKTDKKCFDEIVKFAQSINMIPLAANEEKSGYLLNSMLVPFLLSAMDMVANGVSDPETIDKAWTLGTGAPAGPFQILDVVGLITAKNIVLQYQKVPNIFDPLLKKMMLPYNFDGMLRVLNTYIDAGKLGKSTGEGFYKYK